jgi:hypothetical protein
VRPLPLIPYAITGNSKMISETLLVPFVLWCAYSPITSGKGDFALEPLPCTQGMRPEPVVSRPRPALILRGHHSACL